MKNPESEYEEPVQLSLIEIQLFLQYLHGGDKETLRVLDLPTQTQLIRGLETGLIEITQKEWTREGYIYDPVSNTFEMEPKVDSRAGFRLVVDTK
jgi:hypothetical protein